MRLLRPIFIVVIFFVQSAFAQEKKNKKLKTELIGTWEFVELRDAQGNKIDTIFHNVPGLDIKGWEIPQGPLRIYNSNGTYSKQFTSQNTDTGTWYYHKRKDAIIQLLTYIKPYSTAKKYMIDNGYAKQNENGEYYGIITERIVELTEDKLILLENHDYRRTFKKRN